MRYFIVCHSSIRLLLIKINEISPILCMRNLCMVLLKAASSSACFDARGTIDVNVDGYITIWILMHIKLVLKFTRVLKLVANSLIKHLKVLVKFITQFIILKYFYKSLKPSARLNSPTPSQNENPDVTVVITCWKITFTQNICNDIKLISN